MLAAVLASSFLLQSVICQRYAERTPLPLPVEDVYEEYYSEAYDFDDRKNVYRWNVKDVPNPTQQFRFCNRMKASYVCDPDLILEREQADKLDEKIKQLYKETPCICDRCEGEEGGIVIGIALVKNVFQPYNEHPYQIIRSFTEKLRSQWNLGKCDNDILIVVVTGDRLSYTDVGGATSAYVSLKEAHRIFLENKAQLSAGHFYEGLLAMLTDYYEMTRNIKRPLKEKLNLGVIIGSVVGAVVMLAIILLVLALLYRRRYRSPRTKMPRTIDEVDESKPEGVASSWRKQDIKVIFDSLKTSSSPSNKYQPCSTNDTTIPSSTFRIDEEEEVIDTTPATAEITQSTEVTHLSNTSSSSAASEMLDKDLNRAVETLSQTFKPKFNKHETDL